MLVYRHTNAAGDQMLMVRRWDDLSATEVRETVGGTRPAVSPDGLELAFERDGVIHVLALAGGPIRTLMDGTRPEWGPDGFVYATSDSGAVRMPATGGALEVISQLAEGEVEHEIYDVLPDGKHALLTVASGIDEIRGLDLGSGEMTPIVEGRSPRYLPSGFLVFEAAGTMMAARFDPKRMELLGPPISVMTAPAWSLSDDGKLFYSILGVGVGSDWQMVWVNRAGELTPVEADWTFTTGPSGAHGWSLSPDDSMIAIRDFNGQDFDIRVKRIGGPFTRVTTDDSDDKMPAWASESTITFLSDRGGNDDVWSRAADGTGEAELVLHLGTDLEKADWTPDGQTLLLTTDGNVDILMFRPGVDTDPTPLITGPFLEDGPAVSPDGRWIAYASDQSGRFEVYVEPFPDVGSQRRQVSINGGRNPRWAHSGREIFFVGPAPSRSLMVVPIEAGETIVPGTPTELFPTNQFLGGASTGQVFSVASDDQRFLFAAAPLQPGANELQDQGPNSALVNNFVEILKQMVGG